MIEPPVLIAGGGPIGLLVAIEMSERGVPCLLVETGSEPIGVRSVRGSRLNMQVRLDIARAYMTQYLGVHAEDAQGAQLRRAFGRTILDRVRSA